MPLACPLTCPRLPQPGGLSNCAQCGHRSDMASTCDGHSKTTPTHGNCISPSSQLVALGKQHVAAVPGSSPGLNREIRCDRHGRCQSLVVFSVCSLSGRTRTPSQIHCTSQEPPNGFSDILPSPTAIEKIMWGARREKGALEGESGIELDEGGVG